MRNNCYRSHTVLRPRRAEQCCNCCCTGRKVGDVRSEDKAIQLDGRDESSTEEGEGMRGATDRDAGGSSVTYYPYYYYYY